MDKRDDLIFLQLDRMNLYLNSLKILPTLEDICQSLRNKERVDWNTWGNRNVDFLRDFLIEEGITNIASKKMIDIMEATINSVMYVKTNIYSDILPKIIDETEGLKVFLLMHSVFDINKYTVDGLETFMVSHLGDVTLDDMQAYEGGNYLTPEITSMFKDFDVVGEMASKYPLELSYKVYHNRDRNAPINMDWIDWRRDKVHYKKGINAEDMIKRQRVIIC